MRNHIISTIGLTGAANAQWSTFGAAQHAVASMLVRGTKIDPCLGPGGFRKGGYP